MRRAKEEAMSTKQRVLVIGGTRGLGRAYAADHLSHGDGVIVVGRSVDSASVDPILDGAECVAADIGDPFTHNAILDAAFADPTRLPTQVMWCAGNYHRGPLAQMSLEVMDRLTSTHFLGPAAFLGAFHKRMLAHEAKQPYDLVVIGSVFAHVPGKLHAMLAGLKAAKVQFARVFSHELSRDLPGSMTFIVNPWAMKTDFFAGTDVKTDKFMEPAYVVGVINDNVASCSREASLAGKGAWPVEITLDRGEGGATKVLLGPQPPKL